MVNQEHPASLSADRRTDGFNQSSLDQHRTRHRNATHRTRLKRAVNYALLAYRVVLTVEWTSVLLLGLHHLLTTKTRQNKATPLALLTDYVNDYISFQHLPSAVQPIARKARGLYSVIGFSLRVVLASEFIQVLVGACNACGSVKLDSQKSFASRVALKLWAGQSAMREWIGRLLVVRYVLEPFVIMQSTGVTAFILLGWSLSSSIAYFSLVLQDFYRGYAVIDELNYVVNNYLKPLIGLATVRLIYMSIPDSCLWWFPHTKADLAMLSDTAQYSPIIKQAVKKVVPNALQADDFNAMPFI